MRTKPAPALSTPSESAQPQNNDESDESSKPLSSRRLEAGSNSSAQSSCLSDTDRLSQNKNADWNSAGRTPSGTSGQSLFPSAGYGDSPPMDVSQGTQTLAKELDEFVARGMEGGGNPEALTEDAIADLQLHAARKLRQVSLLCFSYSCLWNIICRYVDDLGDQVLGVTFRDLHLSSSIYGFYNLTQVWILSTTFDIPMTSPGIQLEVRPSPHLTSSCLFSLASPNKQGTAALGTRTKLDPNAIRLAKFTRSTGSASGSSIGANQYRRVVRATILLSTDSFSIIGRGGGCGSTSGGSCSCCFQHVRKQNAHTRFIFLFRSVGWWRLFVVLFVPFHKSRQCTIPPSVLFANSVTRGIGGL